MDKEDASPCSQSIETAIGTTRRHSTHLLLSTLYIILYLDLAVKGHFYLYDLAACTLSSILYPIRYCKRGENAQEGPMTSSKDRFSAYQQLARFTQLRCPPCFRALRASSLSLRNSGSRPFVGRTNGETLDQDKPDLIHR